MGFLTGAIGAGLVIAFYVVGVVCGYYLRTLREFPAHQNTNPDVGTSGDAENKNTGTHENINELDEIRAFQTLLSYGPDDAYGLTDMTDRLMEGGENLRADQ